MGIRFAGRPPAFIQAGLAGALGTVEVRPLDLVCAYGTLANGGVHMPPRMILEVRDRRARSSGGRRRRASARSARDRVPGHRHPEGQHRLPSVNPIWAAKLAIRNGPGGTAPACRGQDRHGERRARPLDVRVPRAAGQPEGARAGRRRVAGQQRPFDAAVGEPGDLAHGRRAAVAIVMRRLTNGEPVTDFRQPERPRPRARSTPGPAGRPGPWTRETRTELFRVGTQPGAPQRRGPPGPAVLRRVRHWMVDPVKAELGPRRGTRRCRLARPRPARASGWAARSDRGRRSSGAGPAGAGPSSGRAVPAPKPAHGNGNGNGPPPGHGPAGGPPGQPPASPPAVTQPRRRRPGARSRRARPDRRRGGPGGPHGAIAMRS